MADGELETETHLKPKMKTFFTRESLEMEERKIESFVKRNESICCLASFYRLSD